MNMVPRSSIFFIALLIIFIVIFLFFFQSDINDAFFASSSSSSSSSSALPFLIPSSTFNAFHSFRHSSSLVPPPFVLRSLPFSFFTSPLSQSQYVYSDSPTALGPLRPPPPPPPAVLPAPLTYFDACLNPNWPTLALTDTGLVCAPGKTGSTSIKLAIMQKMVSDSKSSTLVASRLRSSNRDSFPAFFFDSADAHTLLDNDRSIDNFHLSFHEKAELLSAKQLERAKTLSVHHALMKLKGSKDATKTFYENSQREPFKWAIIRDPYRRFLSYYRDKIEKSTVLHLNTSVDASSASSHNEARSLDSAREDCLSQPSCIEFRNGDDSLFMSTLRKLLVTPLHMMNTHTRSVTDMCCLLNVKYDHVSDTANLDEDVQHVWPLLFNGSKMEDVTVGAVGADVADTHIRLAHVNAKKVNIFDRPEKVRAMYNEEARMIMQALYVDDLRIMKILGYKTVFDE